MLEIFISDIHFPYEDVDALKVVYNLIKDIKPDLIFLGGDILDFYTVSSFSKDPSKKNDWHHDKLHAIKRLEELRVVAPNADIEYIPGNHELRLSRYIQQNAEALYEEEGLTIPKLFKLKELDIQYKDVVWVKHGELLHIHADDPKASGHFPAKTIYDKLNVSFIGGHFHKVQHYSHRAFGHDIHGAWLNGCLCQLTPEYDRFPQWEQSVSIIQYTKSGLFNVDQVIIVTDKKTKSRCCIYGGKMYTAKGVSKL